MLVKIQKKKTCESLNSCEGDLVAGKKMITFDGKAGHL